MADIVFKYVEMRNAVTAIHEIAVRYKNAANTFEASFRDAISTWEGESKDAMQNFISGPVMEYAGETVPALLDGLAEMLSANADQMEQADSQLAQNIPTSL